MLYVSEIFHSIQGEGPHTGHPAIFLRTAGCNLRCTWCDTPYALELRQGTKMETLEVIERIKEFDCQHLVITGGEPLIQQKGLAEVLQQLKGYYVEVETNGGFESTIDEYIDQYNCSPKLPGSGNKPYPLKIYPGKKTWYKFVIDDEEDLKETLQFIVQYQIPKKRVRLMPQGETRSKSIEKSTWLIEQCKKYGYIFNPRLHVLIWNNKKGI